VFSNDTKVTRADLDSGNGIPIFYTTFCQSICYIGLRKERESKVERNTG